MTSQQLTALQQELAKSQYTSYETSGDYNSIVSLLNAPVPTGNHFISRSNLKNILDTNGVDTALYTIANTPSNQYAIQAGYFLAKLNDPDYTDFRLENPMVQQAVTMMQTLGVMTSAQVTQLEAQFTPEMTSIAQGILQRPAVLEDITQALGTPLLTQIQNAISYATAKSATVLQPLYEAWQTKQSSFQQYIQTLQQAEATLTAGNPAQVPTNAEIDAVIQ